jgi:hypothetical protein
VPTIESSPCDWAAEGRVGIPGCEGFVLDLDAVWAEIEDLEDGSE